VRDDVGLADGDAVAVLQRPLGAQPLAVQVAAVGRLQVARPDLAGLDGNEQVGAAGAGVAQRDRAAAAAAYRRLTFRELDQAPLDLERERPLVADLGTLPAAE
jgi:hypothetical protein